MSFPKLIDAHTHVQFAAYENDMEAVIKRSLDNNIWLVNIGTQKNTSAKALDIANSYKEGVYATIGLHPIHTEQSYHDAQELGSGEVAKEFASREEKFDYDYYLQLGKSQKVLAVGECGLDYYRLSGETKKKQSAALELQIALASELGKPLMIHCRDAFPDLIRMLKTNNSKLKTDYPGIIHFFSGTEEDAKKLLSMGFYFSFGGVTTFTRNYDEVIKFISIEKLILETDAPYVAPAPFRGKRNEPSYVAYVAEAIAKILGVPAETVAERTTENAKKVLKINNI